MVRLARQISISTIVLACLFSGNIYAENSKEVCISNDKIQTNQSIATPVNDIAWKDAKGMPKGIQMVILKGDLTKAEPYTMRLKFPDGTVIPPHWHTNDEQTTILSGTLYTGEGDTVDKDKSKELPAGSFSIVPGNRHHYVVSKGETIIQNDGIGPRDTHFVNPEEWKEMIKKSQE